MLVQVSGHVIGLILFFLVMGSIAYYFEEYLDGLTLFEHWKEYMIEMLSWRSLRFQEQYIITVGVFYVITYFQGLQKKESEKSALALKNKEMQLSLLKSQINPHFLFNTLNSISTLVGSSKERARKVITQLSDIFRYALDSHGDQMVKLIHELDFIENYMRIQRVRFGDRMKFIKTIDPTVLGMNIPPMILQPLIENAVKYGIAPKEEGGTISLTIKRKPLWVHFEVKDDGMGINAKKDLDGNSSGVGIKNTDQRLKSFFGPSSKLRVHAREDGYTVSFSIPVEENEIFVVEEEQSTPFVVAHDA